jgi:hypothetical protein
MRIYDLKINNRQEALGIDSLNPEFSWKFHSPTKNAIQIAYTIQVSKEKKFDGKLM